MSTEIPIVTSASADPGDLMDAAAGHFDAFFKLTPEEEALVDGLMRDIDVSTVGKWYGFPSPLFEPPHVMYFRCGRDSSPRAKALAYAMKQLRWREAPPEVRCAGFEADFLGGGRGLYLCAKLEDHRRFVDWTRARESRKSAGRDKDARSLIADTVRAAGAHIEDFDATPVTGKAVLDARAELAEKRAKKARDRAGG